MSNQKNKELIIKPEATDLDLENFLSKLDAGLVYADPKSITDKKFKIIFPSADADFVVCDDLESISKLKNNKNRRYFIKRSQVTRIWRISSRPQKRVLNL